MDEDYAGHRSGFVAVVGRPNVGKSTLLNRLLKQKIAAVSPRAQTTRRKQLGILTLETAQIIFVDTPGIHKPVHKLGELMNQSALDALRDADLVLWLVDATVKPGSDDRAAADNLLEVNAHAKLPVIAALNKIDLLPYVPFSMELACENARRVQPEIEILEVSCTSGAGLEQWNDWIERHL